MDSLHPDSAHKLTRGLGLYDSTMIVAGSMIGSGIFIVGAEMAREVGSAGWMMVAWVMASLLTIAAALSYGELAAMMPRAGGQYVYLREAFSPLWGFLYGWTLFLVIQTGTIAATALGFSRYLGVLLPFISESHYLLGPVRILPRYAISLSTAQVVSLCVMYFVTWTNSRGLKYGKGIQNVFTTAKIGTLVGVILIGLLGWNWAVVHGNFDHAFTPVGVLPPAPGVSPLSALGLFIGLCSAQIGGLYAADAWNNITFTAGEVRNPARNVPLSLTLGCIVVMAFYILVNLVFLLVLPVAAIQHAPSDRVAASMMDAIFPGVGAMLVAIAIMISAFGCMNGMILSGARAYFAMALDNLFFKRAGRLNDAKVPAQALGMQAIWVTVLVLMRTYDPATGAYGNLYSSLLDYVVSAGLIFYILTIAGLFRLRKTQPNAERPYKAFGYPWVPAFYIVCALVILAVLFLYRPATTFPGVVIVAIGVPVYYAFRWNARRDKTRLP